MAGWDAPGAAAYGTCGRFRRRKRKIAATAMEITAMPPTTPPTMAPTFVLLFFVGVGEGRAEEEWPEEAEGPVAVT
jgi:hypothetical protein